jgi:hypothetical protein
MSIKEKMMTSALKNKVEKGLAGFKDLEMGDGKKPKQKRSKSRPAMKEEN